MAILFTVSAVIVLLALLMLTACLRQIRRGRVARASGSLAGGMGTAAIGTAGLLLGTSYLGYDRLTDETLIGAIEFRAEAPGLYTARLMRDGRSDRFFQLAGDEWQIDARIVTWDPPATLFGMEPVYELERLSGRYSNITDEQSRLRTVHGLSDSEGNNLLTLARQAQGWMPFVNAYYGTATYVPIADGARYEIRLSRDAVLARPANEQAALAVSRWGSE